MAAIEVRDLTKVFYRRERAVGTAAALRALVRPRQRAVAAVQDVGFDVAAGQLLAFIGPNGAGKSTTIKMLTGILFPSGGSARVLGLVPWEQRVRLAFRIGAVFGQRSQLLLHLPPGDAFDLLARIYELDWDAYRQRRAELVERFELAELLGVPVRKLSLGQRMRCEIAASLLHRPQVLFLDEPTIGLDPVAKGAVRELIRHANREEGMTVFLTSHDAGDIEALCKRVIVINAGRLVLDDSVSNLRRHYMGSKVIDLKLAEAWAGIEAPGVSVVKGKGLAVKLRVDLAQAPIEAVVSRLLQRYHVEDITIEDPPMEEIIAAIYRAQAEGGRGQ